MSTIVRQFREILLWPLRLNGDHSQNGLKTLKLRQRELLNSGIWRSVNPCHHVPDADPVTEYAELVYFHPFVQEFLFAPAEDGPLRIFTRSDVKSVRVGLAPLDRGGPERVVELDVPRVQLYLFQTGVAVFVMEVAARDVDLGTAEDLLDSLRRAYPPYWDGANAGHCPRKVELLGEGGRILAEDDYSANDKHQELAFRDCRPPVSAHWARALLPLRQGNDSLLSFLQIEDERIPVMAYLSLDKPHELRMGDFVRLAFLDDRGESRQLPYSEPFLKDFQQSNCYDRYWDAEGSSARYGFSMTTRYLCSGYSFVMVGAESDKTFYANGTIGALAHFRHHYFQMGLVAQMQKATLLAFSWRLAESTKLLQGPPEKEDLFLLRVRKIQQDLADFTSRFWFTELSNQIQARELFQWWSRLLGTPSLFQEVLEESRFVGEVFHTKQQERLDLDGRVLNVLIALLASPALVVSFYQADAFRRPMQYWAGEFLFRTFIAVVLFQAFRKILVWYLAKRKEEKK